MRLDIILYLDWIVGFEWFAWIFHSFWANFIIYSKYLFKKRIRKKWNWWDILGNNLTITNIFDLLFFYFYFPVFFYLLPRFKFWIELLDLSDSLKYFIPSEPIWFPIPNIYSKKKIWKIELIRYFDHHYKYLQNTILDPTSNINNNQIII